MIHRQKLLMIFMGNKNSKPWGLSPWNGGPWPRLDAPTLGDQRLGRDAIRRWNDDFFKNHGSLEAEYLQDDAFFFLRDQFPLNHDLGMGGNESNIAWCTDCASLHEIGAPQNGLSPQKLSLVVGMSFLDRLDPEFFRWLPRDWSEGSCLQLCSSSELSIPWVSLYIQTCSATWCSVVYLHVRQHLCKLC